MSEQQSPTGDDASREAAKRMSVRGPSPYPLFEQDAAYLTNNRGEWDAVYLRAAGLRLLEALHDLTGSAKPAGGAGAAARAESTAALTNSVARREPHE